MAKNCPMGRQILGSFWIDRWNVHADKTDTMRSQQVDGLRCKRGESGRPDIGIQTVRQTQQNARRHALQPAGQCIGSDQLAASAHVDDASRADVVIQRKLIDGGCAVGIVQGRVRVGATMYGHGKCRNVHRTSRPHVERLARLETGIPRKDRRRRPQWRRDVNDAAQETSHPHPGTCRTRVPRTFIALDRIIYNFASTATRESMRRSESCLTPHPYNSRSLLGCTTEPNHRHHRKMQLSPTVYIRLNETLIEVPNGCIRSPKRRNGYSSRSRPNAVRPEITCGSGDKSQFF